MRLAALLVSLLLLTLSGECLFHAHQELLSNMSCHSFSLLEAPCFACPLSTYPLSCGQCLAVNTAQATWAAAGTACSNNYNGGELLTVNTEDELRAARRYSSAQAGTMDFWVGYSYSSGSFQESDGTPASPVVNSSVAGGRANGNCLILRRDGSLEGQSCTVQRPSLCLFNFTSKPLHVVTQLPAVTSSPPLPSLPLRSPA